MKRLFTLLLIFILTAAVTGCGGEPTTSQEQKSGKPSATNSAETEADMKKALDDLDKAMDVLAVKGWPKAKLPPDLPEYTEGTIVNSGGSDTDFIVKIEDSSEDALNRYLEKLKSLDWNLSENMGPVAKKGIYSLEFTWQGGGTMLQMSVYTSQIGQWPKDKVPADITPPENCTFIGDMNITEIEVGRAWYFNYECQGIDADRAMVYMDKMRNSGWSGDDSMIHKEFEWNGQTYSASIEIYETVGDTTTFTCNYGIED